VSLVVEQPPAREERKVVTVLFADLVGFTSRAERLDPEDVRALLSPYYARLRSELERFGGTVEKFIGDAVMALFGAPVAHEDDPERAVRAAFAIRDWLAEEQAELRVRIGITTGEALIALGARPSEGEGMASGDVVNTAARLQAAAPVGGVLVDRTTYRATGQAVEYRDAVPVEAKGKTEPIEVWEAVQARSRFGVDVVQSGAPLVGRERELELLQGTLQRVREESSPQLLTLVGEPGIGKSRLVFELFSVVGKGSDLTYWRQGRSLPYGEGVTFWALAEMVKAHAGILEMDASAEASAKLAGVVAAAIAAPAEAQWVERHLRPLVGLASDAELGGERRSEAFAAWRRLFEALAERYPLVLVFEDLQWADDDLLDFVDYLVEWSSGAPLLVLCTARPELLVRRPGWGGGKRNASTLSLSPLSDEEIARLIGLFSDRPVLLADTQTALLARAGGNPLYAEQYSRMLSESAEGGELGLPESIQGIIAARLDLLPLDEKRLLQDAAVVGKVFWSGALAAIGGHELWQLEEHLHALERKEFVQPSRRSSVGDEREYAFRHLLVRDVAYGQIPRAERAERHRLAAEWIESLGRAEDHAEMLAHHYADALELARAAGLPTGALSERARFALREAGDRASSLNAFAAAARFYEHALELWPRDEPARPALLFRHGRARLESEGSAADLLTEARDELIAVGDRETAAEAEIMLADLAFREGERDRLMRHVAAAAELVSEVPPSRVKAVVLSHVSRYHMLDEANELAIAIGEEALAMATSLGLEEIRAHALNNIGVVHLREGDRRGLDELEQSIHIAREINSPECVRGYINLSTIVGDQGDLAHSRQVSSQGTQAAEQFGDARQLRWLRTFKLKEEYHLGRWDAALPHADELIAECEAGSPHYHEAEYRSIRSLIRLARGEIADALDDSEKAITVARRAKDPQALSPALSTRAHILFEAGQEGEAGAAVDEILTALPDAIGRIVNVDIARVVTPLGRRDAFLAAIERIARESLWLDAARAIAVEEFEDAADLFAKIGSTPDEAFARLRAAQQLVKSGRRAEADVQLHKALAFFRSVGATRYLREGETVLAASA
jgi:class 3 adenylate cyclase/tetratricopeptide (TPR) repeat protein